MVSTLPLPIVLVKRFEIQIPGPIYMKKDSGRNVFNEIAQHVKIVKDLVGPVYQSKDMSHGYSEIVKQAAKLSALNGPVYLDENNRNRKFARKLQKICRHKLQ